MGLTPLETWIVGRDTGRLSINRFELFGRIPPRRCSKIGAPTLFVKHVLGILTFLGRVISPILAPVIQWGLRCVGGAAANLSIRPAEGL
jgi:hypothetical protein